MYAPLIYDLLLWEIAVTKYNVVYGEENDSWLIDADCVEDVIKQYNEQDIGGGEPIHLIYEMKDVTPPDITNISTASKIASNHFLGQLSNLPDWWNTQDV